MHNLITFGSPHGGVASVPNCKSNTMLCRFMKRVIETSVYTKWAQTNVIQAQYFRDAARDDYFTSNKFLTDVNTELDDYNLSYKEQIKKLNKMVLVLFQNDTMVEPKESAVSNMTNSSGLECMIKIII